MKIKNKVAIITGAASGLGEATAYALHQAGARVVLLDAQAEKLHRVAETLGVMHVVTDVTDAQKIEQMGAELVEKLGIPQILVNCAGVATPTKLLSKEGLPSLDHFARVVNINLIGTYNMMRVMASHMIGAEVDADGERGVMINTASVAAFEGQIGQTGYAASKGGVAALTLPCARELAKFGVRVMAIAPGLFETPMLTSMPEHVQQSLVETCVYPKRLGKPGEFAQLVLSIIDNPMLNGDVIRLDGALRMQPR